MNIYLAALMTIPIALISVVGIFVGWRLMKNEGWRPTGISIIFLSLVGFGVSCGLLIWVWPVL